MRSREKFPNFLNHRNITRVSKREFVGKFSQFSCPRRTRTRIGRELISESLYESFLNSSYSVSTQILSNSSSRLIRSTKLKLFEDNSCALKICHIYLLSIYNPRFTALYHLFAIRIISA